MKPLLFVHDCTHYGMCNHHREVDPNSIVLCESSLFTDDPDHSGVWIGRYAEAPWDAMQAYAESTGLSFTWHIVKQLKGN